MQPSLCLAGWKCARDREKGVGWDDKVSRRGQGLEQGLRLWDFPVPL
jgi:hypothetical protein